jgi:hypothetical protein
MTNVPTSRDGAKCQPPESHDDAPRNVYVASLPAAFTDRQLYELAAPYGPIASHRMFNTTKHVAQTGHSYGFVLYANPTAAAAAVEGLADRPLGDRRLQVRLSRNGVVKKRRAAPGGLEGTPGERKLVPITTSPPPGTGTASNGHVDSSLSSNPLDPLPVQNEPSPSSEQQAGNNSLQPSTEAAQEPPQFHADARTAPQAQLAAPWPTAGHYFPNGSPSMPAWLPAHPSFVPMTYPTYPYPAPPFANAGRLQYVAFGHPGAALVSPLGTMPMPPLRRHGVFITPILAASVDASARAAARRGDVPGASSVVALGTTFALALRSRVSLRSQAFRHGMTSNNHSFRREPTRRESSSRCIPPAIPRSRRAGTSLSSASVSLVVTMGGSIPQHATADYSPAGSVGVCGRKTIPPAGIYERTVVDSIPRFLFLLTCKPPVLTSHVQPPTRRK